MKETLKIVEYLEDYFEKAHTHLPRIELVESIVFVVSLILKGVLNIVTLCYVFNLSLIESNALYYTE